MVTKLSLTDTLVAMKPGDLEVIPFGILKDMTIRNRVSVIGSRYGRKYTVRMDKDAQAYNIIRLS